MSATHPLPEGDDSLVGSGELSWQTDRYKAFHAWLVAVEGQRGAPKGGYFSLSYCEAFIKEACLS